MAKRQIGIRELKDNLSAALARVRRGETIVVTNHRRAVALIVPAGATEDTGLVIRALVESGRLSWSGGKPTGLKDAARVRGPSVADAVLEDRR